MAEDNKTERLYISRLFEKLGINVQFAESGGECIRISQQEKFDLIFIDYLMPDIDGIQTLNEMRRDRNGINYDVPVIALGSPDSNSGDDFFIREGFANYIEKPVEYKMLRAALILYLPEKAKDVMDGGQDKENSQALLPGGYEWLYDVTEISVADGIKNCGSAEGYLSALDIFYRSIDDKADEIQGYYDSGDWQNYTIKVHALKSSARIIGAADISALALMLENAGNANDTAVIKEKTEELLDWFRSFREKLGPLSGESREDEPDGRPPAERDLLDDAYSSLIEFAGQMDFDLVEMVINSVREYSLEKKDSEIFSEIEKKFSELDWHGIASAAKKGLPAGAEKDINGGT